MNDPFLDSQLQAFLLEDIQTGDVTSDSIFPPNVHGSGKFIAKEHGVICGLPLIQKIYALLSPDITVTQMKSEGEEVHPHETIATVNGPIRALLTGERLILNLMQRLSGIATLTKQAVDTLNDPSIHICDTRKTTPGLRKLEKYAIRIGGGKNHRFGLYDGVMIKDNHISFCGSISEAVKRVREQNGHMIKVEVETETIEQVKEAIEAKADVIMFDNQKPNVVREWAKLVPDSIITEASGGIHLQTLASYRETGVDCISLGFLTHSATALDISFLEEVH